MEQRIYEHLLSLDEAKASVYLLLSVATFGGRRVGTRGGDGNGAWGRASGVSVRRPF